MANCLSCSVRALPHSGPEIAKDLLLSVFHNNHSIYGVGMTLWPLCIKEGCTKLTSGRLQNLLFPPDCSKRGREARGETGRAPITLTSKLGKKSQYLARKSCEPKHKAGGGTHLWHSFRIRSQHDGAPGASASSSTPSLFLETKGSGRLLSLPCITAFKVTVHEYQHAAYTTFSSFRSPAFF